MSTEDKLKIAFMTSITTMMFTRIAADDSKWARIAVQKTKETLQSQVENEHQKALKKSIDFDMFFPMSDLLKEGKQDALKKVDELCEAFNKLIDDIENLSS